jgi:hypothetical protein
MSQHFPPNQEPAAVHASNALEDLIDELPKGDPLEGEIRALNEKMDARFRLQTVIAELE